MGKKRTLDQVVALGTVQQMLLNRVPPRRPHRRDGRLIDGRLLGELRGELGVNPRGLHVGHRRFVLDGAVADVCCALGVLGMVDAGLRGGGGMMMTAGLVRPYMDGDLVALYQVTV